jgi:transposase
MFIREIKKRIKRNENYYDYVQHRLVESIRTENGPRQRIVLNLGTLDVAAEQYKALANSIEALANNDAQQTLFTNDPKLETLARHFAQVLIRKRVQEQQVSEDDSEVETEPKYVEVDVNSAVSTNGRTIGCEHIGLSYLREIGLFEVLTECGFSEDQQAYAAAQICSRLVHPSSERESARWLRETSGLDELLGGVDFSKISDHTLHRSADQLLAVKEILEEQLSQTTSDLFSLNNKLVLYDLTNTYFESPKSSSELASYGKSKERRNDCPLMTLALMVDEQGFPKHSHIFKGGVSEPHTLWQMLTELDKLPTGKGPRTLVIDAGIATSENLERLRADERFEYVAVNREKLDTQKMFGEVEGRTLPIGRNKKLEVKIKQVGDEMFVLCKSADREAKERAIFARRRTRFEKALRNLNKGLSEPRKVKKYQSVVERIGRLKERYKVGHLYTIDVKREDEIATAVTWRFHRTKAKKPGEYVLRTSHTDLSDAQISSLHRTLTMIESSFRWLKSDLGLRPIYHQYDSRMEAHIFVSVLAYFALAPILSRLNWGGAQISAGGKGKKKEKKTQWEIPYGWASVVQAMATHARVTTSYRCKAKKGMDIRTTLEPTAKQFDIYRRLKVTPRPLKNKVIVNY